jgi:hypothetical protein
VGGDADQDEELREAYLSGDATDVAQWPHRHGGSLYPVYVEPASSGVAAGLVAGEYMMYAGHAHGLTFASQMTKMEPSGRADLRHPDEGSAGVRHKVVDNGYRSRHRPG